MPPVSYLTLPKGTAVTSADGERVGAVELVLADESTGVFDGIVVDTARAGMRFVDAPEVASVGDDGVVIAVAAGDVPSLPAPSANPAVMRHTGVEDVESPVRGRLRTAWHLVRTLRRRHP